MTAQVLRRCSSKSNAAALSAPTRPLPAPTRLSLVAEYFALQNAHLTHPHAPPSPKNAAPPSSHPDYDSDSGPASMTSTTTSTALSAASPAPPPTALRARRAHLRQRRILATLYPTHDALDSHLRARARHASRAVAVKATIAAHTLAMAKLTEAANLLMLAADHAAYLLTSSSTASNSLPGSSISSASSGSPVPSPVPSPAPPANSSSASASATPSASTTANTPSAPPTAADVLLASATDTTNTPTNASQNDPLATGSDSLTASGLASGSCVGALLTSGASALSRASSAASTRRRASSAELLLGSTGCLPELGAPAPFRLRYLRRCWGLAGEALASAVTLSTYLARGARRNAHDELVPGVEQRARRLGLARGRRELLTRVAAEAQSARSAALAWHARQRRFVAKLRRELTRRRRAAAALDERVAQVRRELMTREFEARIVAAVPATA